MLYFRNTSTLRHNPSPLNGLQGLKLKYWASSDPRLGVTSVLAFELAVERLIYKGNDNINAKVVSVLPKLAILKLVTELVTLLFVGDQSIDN